MSGRHSVEKVGGPSMVATGTLFDDVLIAGREGADLSNRALVYSMHSARSMTRAGGRRAA